MRAAHRLPHRVDGSQDLAERRAAGVRSPGLSTGARARGQALGIAAAVALGVMLLAGALTTGVVGDDVARLDAMLRAPVMDLLRGAGGPGSAFPSAPLALHLWWWGAVVRLGPFGLHLVNLVLFAAVAVMLYALVRGWGDARAARFTALAWIVAVPGGVLVGWVSAAQDLLVAVFGVAALLLYRRGLALPAGLALGMAIVTDRVAVPFAVALVAIELIGDEIGGTTARSRRLVFAAAGAAIALVAASLLGVTLGPPAWLPGDRIGGLLALVQGSLLPADAAAGFGLALGQKPWIPLIIAVLAALAVPRGAASRATAPRPLAERATRHERREQERAARRSETAARAEGRAPAASAWWRSPLGLGVVLVGLGCVPLAGIFMPWRGHVFLTLTLGLALLAGHALARIPETAARIALVVAALLHVGAHRAPRANDVPDDPSRQLLTNIAWYRDTGGETMRIVEALTPWCDAIRAAPRTFVAALEPGPATALAIGPGWRIACHDTTQRVRFLAEFDSTDALLEFGVLRWHPEQRRFTHEVAGARTRARIAEGMLLYGRFAPAAACFDVAARERPDDPEFVYPRVASLAAARRADEARRHWEEARRDGRAIGADSLVVRLLGREPSARQDSVRPHVRATAGVMLSDPTVAAPHAELGRTLLEAGIGRAAAIELAIAWGISREPRDLAMLGEGYEAIGAIEEARTAYRQALGAGLDSTSYRRALRRFTAIGVGTLPGAPPGR